MTISPELQARIDALPDPALRADILKTLKISRKHRVSDEGIFEVCVTGYEMAKAQQARMRVWQESEVIAFIEFFRAQAPDLYARFIAHEKDLRDKELSGVDEDERWFDPDIRWDMEALVDKWMPGLDSLYDRGLVGGVRRYAQTHLI